MMGFEVKQMAKPLKKFRAGSVSCALWENEATVCGKSVTMLKADDLCRLRGSRSVGRQALRVTAAP